MLSADKVHSFRRKYVLSSQTNTVNFWWEIQTNESKSPEQVVLPSWKEVLLLCLPVEGQFSGIGCVNCWSQWSWQWLRDNLSSSIGNYKLTPTASGKSCWRWQCFTRSTIPMSPKTAAWSSTSTLVGDKQVVVQLWLSLTTMVGCQDCDDEGCFVAEKQNKMMGMNDYNDDADDVLFLLNCDWVQRWTVEPLWTVWRPITVERTFSNVTNAKKNLSCTCNV